MVKTLRTRVRRTSGSYSYDTAHIGCNVRYVGTLARKAPEERQPTNSSKDRPRKGLAPRCSSALGVAYREVVVEVKNLGGANFRQQENDDDDYTRCCKRTRSAGFAREVERCRGAAQHGLDSGSRDFVRFHSPKVDFCWMGWNGMGCIVHMRRTPSGSIRQVDALYPACPHLSCTLHYKTPCCYPKERILLIWAKDIHGIEKRWLASSVAGRKKEA
ncbi:hypothetical protein K445DRAFT_261309 [Daldinia sp. EC12]|nr:hypothetical protein K445DRAFT_261309 [Daldinia sp. EC12]